MTMLWVQAENDTAPESEETESIDDLSEEEQKKVEETVKVVLETLIKGALEGIGEFSVNENLDEETLKEKIGELVKNLENVENVKVEVVTSSDISEIFKNPEELKELEEKFKLFTNVNKHDDIALKKKIKELVEKLDLETEFFADDDNVKVINTDPIVITKVFTNAKDLTGIIEKVLKLVKDDDLNEEQLTEKLKRMMKDIDLEPIVVSDNDNVKVFVSSNVKDTEEINEFVEKIVELTSDEELDEEQMTEKIKKLFKDQNFELFSRLDIGDIEVITKTTKMPTNMSNNSDKIAELTKRVEQLEKKLDTIIEKLEKLTSK